MNERRQLKEIRLLNLVQSFASFQGKALLTLDVARLMDEQDLAELERCTKLLGRCCAELREAEESRGIDVRRVGLIRDLTDIETEIARRIA